ncbi:MAG: hypothetical protein ACRD88_22865 [Terriglobia bacterium]
MTTEAPSPESVRRWVAGVEEQLSAVQAELAPLVAEQRRLEAQHRLLIDLLRELQPTEEIKAGPATSDTSIGGSNSLGATGRYVIERTIEILHEAGQALHINDLYARFLERGYQVPGAGTPANLTAHIRRSEVIVSPKRGLYGLVEHVGPVQTANRKRARRRPMKRKRAAQPRTLKS